MIISICWFSESDIFLKFIFFKSQDIILHGGDDEGSLQRPEGQTYITHFKN